MEKEKNINETKETCEDHYEIISYGRGLDTVVVNAKTEVDGFGIKWLIVERGATIRTWGTKHGLAQLTVVGMTSETILDAIPFKLKIPVAAVHCRWTLSPEAVERLKKGVQEAEVRVMASRM